LYNPKTINNHKNFKMETKNQSLMMPGAIVVAGIIIAVAIFATSGDKTGSSNIEEYNNNNVVAVASAAEIDDDAILGNPDAPVTWIEFGDYECPFCGQLYGTAKQIKEEYVATGKVRMVFRDFPLSFHPTAVPSAEAAECAGDQGKYWDYHDVLFERQAQASTFDYVAIAKELSLDTVAFKSCVDNRTHKAEVEKDFNDGAAAGVEGTPGVIINGELVAGAYPYEHFKQIIESKLAEGK
jgi:protein-disulfide isomerase